MTKKDPHPKEEWPEEVRLAYEKLAVPSLYECVLANEKLSVEVHRQNQEIKMLSSHVEQLALKIVGMQEFLEEEWDELDEEFEELIHDHDFSAKEVAEEEVYQSLEDKSLDVILDMTDSFLELVKKTKNIPAEMLANEIEQTRYELLSHLNQLDIGVIEPSIGEAYNASWHQAIEKVQGGKPNTIAKVFRAGYTFEDVVLKPAEVVIYQ